MSNAPIELQQFAWHRLCGFQSRGEIALFERCNQTTIVLTIGQCGWIAISYFFFHLIWMPSQVVMLYVVGRRGFFLVFLRAELRELNRWCVFPLSVIVYYLFYGVPSAFFRRSLGDVSVMSRWCLDEVTMRSRWSSYEVPMKSRWRQVASKRQELGSLLLAKGNHYSCHCGEDQ